MYVSAESIAHSPSFRLVRRLIGLSWYALLCITVIAVIYVIVYAVTGRVEPALDGGYRVGGKRGLGLGGATQVPIDVRYTYSTDPFSDRAIPQSVIEGRRVLVDGHSSVRLRLTDGYGALYNALSILFALGISLAIVWQLRELCEGITEGHPFTETNGIRLRRIGLIVIGGSLVYSAASWVTADRYISMVEIPDARLFVDASLHLEDIGLGLLLLVLGQLFQLAARTEVERQHLQVEQELTV